MATTQPTTLTIFGASGDLASRKLLPGIYHLAEQNLLPDNFWIIGAARREITVDSLLDSMRKHIGDNADETIIESLQNHLKVVQMDSGKQDDYAKLADVFTSIENNAGAPATRLFYLSVPPNAAVAVIDALSASGIADGESVDGRILLEKPFGHDLASARELEEHLQAKIGEERMYRVDHYLAKEQLQAYREPGEAFNHMRSDWNLEDASSIDIMILESLGLEGRADFYEQVGALRDVLQNHLIEVMSVIVMNEPDDDSSASLHRARASALKSMAAPMDETLEQSSLRAQYTGYPDEAGSPDSVTETFAALQLTSDNPRFMSIPVRLITGKNLAQKVSIIRINHHSGEPFEISLGSVNGTRVIDGYEKVVHDAITGDRRNFVSGDEVVRSWELVEPLLMKWASETSDIASYEPGSDGPVLPWAS